MNIDMSIDQQIQVLIDQAPQYGGNPADVQTIAPVLKTIAAKLKHLQYYILQTIDQNWLMITLAHQSQPDHTKNVVYAFPSLKAVKASSGLIQDPQIVALPIPIVHILFQMLAMKPLDSIVFFETSDDLQSGTEISRQNLEASLQQYFQGFQPSSEIPSDIA